MMFILIEQAEKGAVKPEDFVLIFSQPLFSMYFIKIIPLLPV